MAVLIQQSTTAVPLLFFMVQSSDHITALTGASPTVTLSKNGAAFGSPAGAVTEIANGWYQVAGNATDTGTLGALVLHATAASGDPSDSVVGNVVSFNPYTANLGLSNVPVNVAQWSGSNVVAPNVSGIPLVDLKYTLGTLSPAAAGYVAIDWGQITNKTTANDLTGTTISALDAGGNNAVASAVFTNAMTESYASVGGTLNLAKFAYGMNQFFSEFGIVSTAYTVKKRDQTTTAKTYTLNSATAPTAITEAT